MVQRWVAESAREDRSGTVNAAGRLELKFGPLRNQVWEISQVSLEMLTAPIGALAEIRDAMGGLMAPSYSARRATASGTQLLNPGETVSVVWTGATPGDTGRAIAWFRKGVV